MASQVNKHARKDPRVVIIGAGMSGILAVIKLREAGINNITVLEKGASVGGTWRDNRYPGLACDIPAPMYTYEFEPNPEWEHRFARGPEIRRYFERVAEKYDVLKDVRFNEEVEQCVYRDKEWHLVTSKGEVLVADMVISATGVLHHPSYPDIEGLESFSGQQFHSSRWPEKLDLKGKRVGIIGTGSTSAQIVPELVKEAAEVVVFQRTPHWIIPAPDRKYNTKLRNKVRKNPRLSKFAYWGYTRFMELTFTRAVIGKKYTRMMFNLIVKLNLKRSIKDPQLRSKLTPDYAVGCKRIIFSTKFYDAILRSNCQLVTEGIDHVESEGIVTEDGKCHDLDILVLATGFKSFNFMRPMQLTGRNGLDINEVWEEKVQVYRSTLIPGFPNFFLMFGPNAPIGNFSVIAMSEVVNRYILKLIERWRNGEMQEIEATVKATQEYNAYIKQGMGNTVCVKGCNSWYLDKDGDPAVWPYTWRHWVDTMSALKLADFTEGAP